jgi:adenosylhomocysteine nucleosidase
MKIEVESLADMLDDRIDTTISGVTFHEGKLMGRDVVLAVSGVGKVFAAVCAQTMIIKFGAQAIINTGVAGGLDERLSICDAVVADFVVEHDMDTTPLGDPPGL